MPPTTTPPIAKRVCDMTPEERLQSLREWAEEQKYIRQGEHGTLPFGIGNMHGGTLHRPQSYSGPVHYAPPQYQAPLAPPSYETVMRETSRAEEKKAGAVKRWMDKRKEKKRANSVAV